MVEILPQSPTAHNQTPPLENYDVYASDKVLSQSVERGQADWAVDSLHELGRTAGGAGAIRLGFEANRNPPELRAFDRYGERVDEVSYHPSYHSLMEVAVSYGLHSSPWAHPRAGAHVARAAAFYIWSQVDAGHGCPISMTHAAVPALRRDAELAREWGPLLHARRYDGTLRPAAQKGSALIGMAMTERQGGSDVRANTTRATHDTGDWYTLEGHKWFCSAPMSDAFLVLAQSAQGISCFFVPRFLPDGMKNALKLVRLKDKLGNRSNASSEIEFHGTQARLVGEEGRGLSVILEMVNFTRLDCVIGSAAGMRQAVAQAIHHATHRRAFGKRLADQPLMQNVLADLALESEAATLLFVRLAQAADAAPHDPRETAFKRIGTAVGKYWVCKRAAPHAAEALECLGGNGYVEEFIMPRLYREAPLNSLWEGAGNINALDVLRAIERDPSTGEALDAELETAVKQNVAYDTALATLRRRLSDGGEREYRARSLVESMAVLLGASLLLRFSPEAVSSAFCTSRLTSPGHTFGTLPAALGVDSIIERAAPQVAC